ncbi:MAG: MFS transporter [Chloroflexota bacterium]|nr:MFS transporter [Chloroflexota bacterium]
MTRLKTKLLHLEQWKRNLYVLFMAQLLSVAGFAVIFPFLPLYVEELGVRTIGSVEFWTGMVFSAQAVTMGIMAPIWGTLADRLGRKLMVERALFGGAIVLTLMGIARSAEELTLLRAIQGAITGVVTAANALVAASAPRERAGWALGLMQTSVWAGVAVGPLIGGVLADAFGFHATFYLTGLLLLLSGVTVHQWVVEERESLEEEAAGGSRSFVEAWKRTLTVEGMSALYGVKFTVRLAASVMLPVAPLLVAALMVDSGRVATVAGIFTAATAAASTLSAVKFGSLGDRIGYRSVLIVGCVASGLTYLLFLWVGQIWQLIALAILVGVANGAVIPSIGALLANASPKGGQGTVYGIDASVNSGARMVAPLIGTAVASWISLQASFAVAGLIFLLAAAMSISWVPQRATLQQAQRALSTGD